MEPAFGNKLLARDRYLLGSTVPVRTKLFKRALLLVSILLAVFFCTAQSIYPSTLNITGQFGTLKNLQFEISIGESTSITTLSNSGLVVTSGILQSSVALQPPINVFAGLDEEIKLYPNPARDFVEVNFVSKMMGVNQYELYDLRGRQLLGKQFFHFGIPRTERLDVSKLTPGTYILSIQQYSTITNRVIKNGSFRIVKVN